MELFKERPKAEDYGLNVFKYGVDLEIYIDKLEKQLILNGVSRSLPTEEEMILELVNQVEKRDFDNKTPYAENFILGFNTCFNWLKNKQA